MADGNDSSRLKEILSEAAEAAGLGLEPDHSRATWEPAVFTGESAPGGARHTADLFYLQGAVESAYLLMPAGNSVAAEVLAALRSQKAPLSLQPLFTDFDPLLAEEYLFAREELFRRSGGESARFLLRRSSPTTDVGPPAGDQVRPGDRATRAAGDRATRAAGAGLLLFLDASDLTTKPSTDNAADLIAGRALLDEALLEEQTGLSWLLLRCERIALVGSGEVEKLLGSIPEEPGYHERSSRKQFEAAQLAALSEESRRRVRDIATFRAATTPGFASESAPEKRAFLLFLFRGTRGEAVGSLQSARLLFVGEVGGATVSVGGLYGEIGTFLNKSVEIDREAGLSWLRLLAPRRYQLLKPSSSVIYLYHAIFTNPNDPRELQRIFSELRREAPAFRAFGRLLVGAPLFQSSPAVCGLSRAQRELLLPRTGAFSQRPEERLLRIVEASRAIEKYARENPSTPSRPALDLFQRLGREQLRRTRKLVEASVEAGVFSALFEHARLGWLQRAWSRVHRREMVLALAFEPSRVVERAGTLYSRRGRELLKEDAAATARRAAEFEPVRFSTIAAARRRLWTVLVEQLFDGESAERYAAELTATAAKGGLSGAIAALHILRLGELRPGVVDAKARLQAAARVAAEPALDGESTAYLLSIAEEPRLLRQGGSRFAWLLAHALERMGRPEAGAEALGLVIKQLTRQGADLPPEEGRRARRLAKKYRELTN